MAVEVEKLDLVVVGNGPEIVSRCQDVAQFARYTFRHFANVDDLFTASESLAVKFVVVIGAVVESKEVANLVQVSKQCCADAFQLVVVGRKIPVDTMVFVKKSGADCVILENEFVETCKFEFIANLAIRAAYIPIKSAELRAGTAIGFAAFHLMPLNQKYLRVIAPGETLTEKKRARLQEVSEFYCRRESATDYAQYLVANTDRTAEGLTARCRAQFLALTAGYGDLVLLITDQSESASFDAGKKLYEKCRKTAAELLTNLGAVGSAWDVITNSAVDDFGTIERSPAVAAYAGLLSLTREIGNAEDVVLSALLCDIGTLELNPSIPQKLKQGKPLNAEEQEHYGRLSLVSLNRCLSRKIPIPEKMKAIMTAAYERVDGKGAQQLEGKNVPLEAQLIHLCRLIDQAASIKWGEGRKSPAEVRAEIIERERLSGKFSPILFQMVNRTETMT